MTLQRPPIPASITPPFQPQISDEMRNTLTSLLQELLLKTHELSFEYSTLDCESLGSCQLAQKSKELFKVVKKLNEFIKKMAADTSKASYIQ